MDRIFSNAKLVLADEVVQGSLTTSGECIAAIDTGNTATAGAIDCAGDYLIPGLVELHTDNMERHFMPRPQTFWPNGLAAAITHDSEIATAGITTVFDSFCVGAYDVKSSHRPKLFQEMTTAVALARKEGAFRSDHWLHLRCELTDPELDNRLASVGDLSRLKLVSLMDHTPGQRQWRDLDALRTFQTRSGKSTGEIEDSIQERIERGSRYVRHNRDGVLARFAAHKPVFASHDDTTADHISEAVADGVSISEFPCSLEAASAARSANMQTIGGAPNVVRGGSHSGNVSMLELAKAGVLDGLSSDYVPASLLQAAFSLVDQSLMSVPEAIALVTLNPVTMVGLSDRGSLASGLRADLVRVRMVGTTPVIQTVYRGGMRVA